MQQAAALVLKGLLPHFGDLESGIDLGIVISSALADEMAAATGRIEKLQLKQQAKSGQQAESPIDRLQPRVLELLRRATLPMRPDARRSAGGRRR